MSKDTLSEYSNNNTNSTPNLSGGVMSAKPIANYKPPVGPMGINDPKTPGIHGTNHGNCGTQGG